MKVVPTKAVAMPETSSSTRTRSTASRTIRRWSNASSMLSSRMSDDGDERGVRCVGAGDDRPHVAKDGEVRDRDDVRARVAPGIAVGAELGQQARDVDARLLGELASRRLVQRLVGTLEPAGNRPHALERLLAPADEENVEDAVGHGQDDHVHRDREGRERARVVPGRDVRPPRSCHHDYYSCTGFWSCQPKRVEISLTAVTVRSRSAVALQSERGEPGRWARTVSSGPTERHRLQPRISALQRARLRRSWHQLCRPSIARSTLGR